MRKTIWLLLCAFTSLFVSACAGAPPGPEEQFVGASDEPLNAWVANQLTPYLARQLGKHPKFKDQPFLPVRMKGDDVQAQIDDLTDQVRERVMDGLLTEPGINLVWRPAVRPWQRHQSLEEIHCADYKKIRYYVGIDTGLTKVDGRLYVKVRALDLKEGSWVSGFGMSWLGSPTEKQAAALDRAHTDEYLRGLRPLPFTDTEPDLLASYLAHNLSCLFKQRETDEIVVYVDRTEPVRISYFKTVFDLVENYLVRFREVRVTRDPARANVTLKTEIHPIHGELYQVWASALYKDGDRYLPGTETEAYVHLEKRAATPGTPQPRPIRPVPKPVSSAQISRPLIASFDLLTPVSRAFCHTNTPWLLGERYLDEDAHLRTGGCVGVTVSLAENARIYLFGRNPRGELIRLFPSRCNEFADIDNRMNAGDTLRFPPLSDSGIQALALTETPGTESVYAVAVASADLARRFEKNIAGIPGLCHGGETGAGKGLGIATADHDVVSGFQRYLEAMTEEGRGAFEWRVRRFQHEP